jgi:hypothetical protein
MCSFPAIQGHDQIFVPLVVSQKQITTRRREAAALRIGFAIPHVMLQGSHIVPPGEWFCVGFRTGFYRSSRTIKVMIRVYSLETTLEHYRNSKELICATG